MNWIRKALTKRISVRVGRRKQLRKIEIEPSERLVYAMYFAIAALVSLTILEATYIMVLRTFSSEIFSAIAGLIGTIMGVLITSRG